MYVCAYVWFLVNEGTLYATAGGKQLHVRMCGFLLLNEHFMRLLVGNNCIYVCVRMCGFLVLKEHLYATYKV
jgi:hypothetical protein